MSTLAVPALQGSLFIDERCRPMGQLLKWVGNKFKYAEAIAGYLPRDLGTYYEPFAGTAAVLATLRPEHALATDSFDVLIEFHRLVQTDPAPLVAHYARLRSEIVERGRDAFEEIRARYNENPNPLDLLVISRTCYGGVMRFTRSGTISTPMGPHKPMPADKLERYMVDWQDRLAGVKFECRHYKETIALAGSGDTVYCDPPYVHGQRILYGAQDFSIADLWAAIAAAANRGAHIAVSIDGYRRSGAKHIDLGLPADLFQRELLIDRGGCMLRRFQLAGSDMAEELVGDRLLLTW
jgi:DNA adenine methylase